jgi:ADP-heptose:LPS heptosyltransferase
VRAFKIGIAWQGNPHHRWDRHRSIPLVQFAPLARLEGVQLYSLQKGPGTEQLAAVASRLSVTEVIPGAEMTPETFMETAAILKNLDLVITVDTAIAHLASALAVPVWVALSVMVDWRWLREREESPWYPTMRLFRQKQLGDWPAVFERMAMVLSQHPSPA